jgi:succinate-acetate transporter protein
MAKADLEAANYAEPAPRAPVWSQAIGNPAPLGLLAFGMTTWFLMSVDALWSGKVFVGAVMGYAYAYGGFAQMVAGVLEVRRVGAGRGPHAWGARLAARARDDPAGPPEP